MELVERYRLIPPLSYEELAHIKEQIINKLKALRQEACDEEFERLNTPDWEES